MARVQFNNHHHHHHPD
ncbi:his operon leader peptide [Cronobacter malonaticus]|nr:his operon leader peptide [Cronobacter malonaticus]ELQ6264428.1 his operon leader peptide [Cronobacter malonaticus]ELY4599992.1 his operon leader peptide [Cronobacter malonaticus]ELY5940486.1 his operon leader peptide [Cronobacter malonaticus]ELY6205702.1 his operon leader peptide [Cronobacter malonaticus]ELY6260168.1 his operon leader peptide [Cronobacter malonaticus]